MTDLGHVATFIIAVKYRGFREAVRQTGLPQSTVTQYIKQLGRSLQVRLTDRATMPQSLALEGKILFPYVEQLLRTGHETTVALHNKSLVVDANSNIGIYLLQPYIRMLQDESTSKIDMGIGENVEIAALLETLEMDVAVMKWWDSRPGFIPTV